jgi:hypothetical protein
MCVLYHNFYCIFYCYVPSTYPGLRYLNSYMESDMGNTRGLNLAAVKHTTVQVSKTAVVAKATSSRA